MLIETDRMGISFLKIFAIEFIGIAMVIIVSIIIDNLRT
jgi:hypothetical protein